MVTAVGEKTAENGCANDTPSMQREPPAFRSEAELEAAIAAAYQRLINAPTWEEKLERWREMVKLIDQRTPARVRFMERMRGLA